MSGMSEVAQAVAEHIRYIRYRRVREKEDFDEIFNDLVSSGKISGTPELLEAIKSEIGRQLQLGWRNDPPIKANAQPKFLSDRFKLDDATPEQATISVDGYLVTFRRVQGKIRIVSREGRRLEDADFRRAHAMAVEAILAAGRDAKRSDERRRAQSW